eukprot:scaffold19324_cov152-Cylindrotheca_fusiformis.AAC.11
MSYALIPRARRTETMHMDDFEDAGTMPIVGSVDSQYVTQKASRPVMAVCPTLDLNCRTVRHPPLCKKVGTDPLGWILVCGDDAWFSGQKDCIILIHHWRNLIKSSHNPHPKLIIASRLSLLS